VTSRKLKRFFHLASSQIRDRLNLEAVDLKLEVTALLDTTATIMVDAYQNRTGEVSALILLRETRGPHFTPRSCQVDSPEVVK
jgi:hypothetical protein